MLNLGGRTWLERIRQRRQVKQLAGRRQQATKNKQNICCYSWTVVMTKQQSMSLA